MHRAGGPQRRIHPRFINGSLGRASLAYHSKFQRIACLRDTDTYSGLRKNANRVRCMNRRSESQTGSPADEGYDRCGPVGNFVSGEASRTRHGMESRLLHSASWKFVAPGVIRDNELDSKFRDQTTTSKFEVQAIRNSRSPERLGAPSVDIPLGNASDRARSGSHWHTPHHGQGNLQEEENQATCCNYSRVRV